MRSHIHLLFATSIATGCVATDDINASEQEATDPAQRVYNIVSVVLPAGNHDGVPGDECVALVDPEHRLRTAILVEDAGPGGACQLSAYAPGDAVSFTWGDTAAYTDSAGRLAVRAAVGDSDGAVHRLVGTTTSEAAALADLQAFLAGTFEAQAAALQTYTAKRVHSLFDFEGTEEELAEAAYQAVRVTQPCENPGAPRLDARFHLGYVYGHTASNSGSCHSGWFSKLHVYNRVWRLVAKIEYSE